VVAFKRTKKELSIFVSNIQCNVGNQTRDVLFAISETVAFFSPASNRFIFTENSLAKTQTKRRKTKIKLLRNFFGKYSSDKLLSHDAI
jgi:hypothetical protein